MGAQLGVAVTGVRAPRGSSPLAHEPVAEIEVEQAQEVADRAADAVTAAVRLSHARIALIAVAGGQDTVGAALVALRGALDGPLADVATTAVLRAADTILRTAYAANRLESAVVALIDPAAANVSYIAAGAAGLGLAFTDGSAAHLAGHGLPCALAASADRPPALTVADLAGVATIAAVTDVRAAAGAVPGAPKGTAARCALLMAESGAAAGAAICATLPAAMPAPAGVSLPRVCVRWSFDADAASASEARHAFMACLRAKPRVDLAAAELVFGEMLGNVVRHALGPVDVTLDWWSEPPVLHVEDRGPGFRSRRRRERLPQDDLSENGRGLFLINACAKNFVIRARDGGGTHATATLALDGDR